MHQKASSSVKWDNKISQQAEFKGDDPLLNLRCIGFWIASILWLVRFFFFCFNYFIYDWESADVYKITIEHIINAGEQMITILLQIVNTIFNHGSVPDILKVGLLTPIRILLPPVSLYF
jgi:hypothetical protein